MENYSFFFICEFNMVFCKANCSWKDWFRDRWVKLRNIKLLFSIILNQSITFSEFFHWLNCSLFLKFWLTLSKIDLLILPMLLFEGLIWKFGLWSFNDINAVFFARHSSLLSSSNFFEMCLASILMVFSRRFVDFR